MNSLKPKAAESRIYFLVLFELIFCNSMRDAIIHGKRDYGKTVYNYFFVSVHSMQSSMIFRIRITKMCAFLVMQIHQPPTLGMR